jgi:mRNA interferase RelE/StbE
MKYTVHYSTEFNDDLAILPSKISVLIVKKIGSYIQTPNPLKFAKRLSGEFNDYYRFRIGDYRALFKLNNSQQLIILAMLRVKHRKEIYD